MALTNTRFIVFHLWVFTAFERIISLDRTGQLSARLVMSTAWRPLQIGSLRAGLSQSCVDDVCAAVAAKVQWWFNSVDFDFPTGGWELAMAFSWRHTCTRASTLPPMSWLRQLLAPEPKETNTPCACRSCAGEIQCCGHELTGQRMSPNGFHFTRRCASI